MALTPLRWIAAAIGGALVVSTLLLRDRPESRRLDSHDLLRQHVQELSSRAWRATDHARAMQVIDSVVPLLARMPRSDTSRVVFDRTIASGLGPYMARMVTRDIVDRPARPRIPVDVVFVLDTATTVFGFPRAPRLQTRAEWVLPRASGERCIVIARVREIRPDFRFARRIAPRLLGPCAFYEAFGMPGPRVDEWLMRGGWQFGSSASWVIPAISRPDDSWMTQWMWLRHWMSINGLRCAGGDADACTELMTLRQRQLTPSDVWISPPRYLSIATLSEWNGWRPRTLGPLQNRILGDMVRDLGPQRFERFWTSGEPMTGAFHGAAGRDLGDWVTDWAHSAYGESGRGPAVPSSGLFLALGLVTVAAAGAGIAATRRQVR